MPQGVPPKRTLLGEMRPGFGTDEVGLLETTLRFGCLRRSQQATALTKSEAKTWGVWFAEVVRTKDASNGGDCRIGLHWKVGAKTAHVPYFSQTGISYK